MSEQPEALRLAERLSRDWEMDQPGYDNVLNAADELRRLHSVNAELLEALQSVVAAWGKLHGSTVYVEGIGDRMEDLEFREMQVARAAIRRALGQSKGE